MPGPGPLPAGAQPDLAEFCSERVPDQQPAGQRVADAANLLQDFRGLQRAHDPGDGAEHAGLAATGDGAFRRRLRIQAAIAGAGGIFVRLEGGKLALEPQDRGGDQRFAGGDAGIRQQEAGVKIVGAVADDVVAGDQVPDVVGGEPDRVFAYFHQRVNLAHRLGSRGGLRLPDSVRGMGHLALEVGEFQPVRVHQPDGSDTGGGEVQAERRAEPAGANNQSSCGLQPGLAGAADLPEQNMAGVSLDFGFGKTHIHWDCLEWVRVMANRRGTMPKRTTSRPVSIW